ncbi:MAG: hypothetical protein JNJ42_07120 [Burkholderiaceae bacterium]|nr:hypothetical protein [Burkholderiaceae bacterium]
MEVFEWARLAHIAIGVVVLGSFWAAALAAKGQARHRQTGRWYVTSMALLLAVTLLMAAGMVRSGTPMRAVFNVYVTLISVASVWMAWRSVRDRHDVRRYLGWPYRLICVALGGYGLFLLAMVPRMGSPARMAMVTAFAVLGLVIAGAMAWRWMHRDDHPRWWLSEHLTAMGINFAATHASFSILAGGSVFAALKEPWTRTAILVAWMVSALVVRLWAGRRFLRRGDDAAARSGRVAVVPSVAAGGG